MALITCPKCGKQISDTTEKCIHCGYDLREGKEEQTELKQYYKLPSAEQKALRAEFYKTDPAYAQCDRRMKKQEKKINISFILNLVSDFLWITFLVVGQIYHAATHNDATVFAIICLIFFGIALAALIANYILRLQFRKHKHNHLIIEKRYQKWLRTEKAIIYKVQFTEKQKRDKAFFDEINVDRTQLEV